MLRHAGIGVSDERRQDCGRQRDDTGDQREDDVGTRWVELSCVNVLASIHES